RRSWRNLSVGADGGTRTRTRYPGADFKSAASTFSPRPLTPQCRAAHPRPPGPSAGLDPGRLALRLEPHGRQRPRPRGSAVVDRLEQGAVDLDVDFEQRGVGRFPDIDAERVVADLDITAHDLEPIPLQCRQKFRGVAAGPLMGEHDLQPVLGGDRAGA